MGSPAPFPGANIVFTAPEGREDVCDLRCFTNGHANVFAVQLDEEELAEVTRTGIVFVSILSGKAFYPAFVGSEDSVRRLVADYGKVWPREVRG